MENTTSEIDIECSTVGAPHTQPKTFVSLHKIGVLFNCGLGGFVPPERGARANDNEYSQGG